jgi:metal-responsive CopG/Arc/MetJ family transcriptional regulator
MEVKEMPTDKPRYTITLDKEMLDKIDDFRFKNRFPNRTQATLELIRIGIETIEKNKGCIKAEKQAEYNDFKSHKVSNSNNYSEEFSSDDDIEKELESYRKELEFEKAAKMSGASQPLEDENHA